MKNSISIGPRFFSVEKQNYSSWRRALVREAIQNMVDSPGCTRIEINTEKVNNGNSTKLTFIDNGGGLSKETLLNVFLVMGNTGKDDGNGNTNNSLGGYGRARVILCWAQENYSITSHKYYLTGCGAEYDIKETKDFYRGCKFEITSDNSDWENIIKFVLDRSSLNQSVFVNGEKYVNTLRRGRMVRELSFANVFVNKSASPQFLVRVGGCWMFSKHIDNVKAQICVELKPETSRDSMVSNRDGLQYEKDNELQSFLNELAVESRGAIKDKTRHFKKFVNKNKCFTTKAKPKLRVAESGGGMIRQSGAVTEVVVSNVNTNIPGAQAIYQSNINPVETEGLAVYQKDQILESMMILCETDDIKTVQRIKQFWMPQSWTNDNSTRYKFVKVWHKIVEMVLETYVDWTGGEYNWAIGLVFAESTGSREDITLAKHCLEDNVHFILINPLDEKANMRFSINNKDDIKSMVTSAAHEISHFNNHNHNQDYAYCLTDLFERVLWRIEEICRAIKEIK